MQKMLSKSEKNCSNLFGRLATLAYPVFRRCTRQLFATFTFFFFVCTVSNANLYDDLGGDPTLDNIVKLLSSKVLEDIRTKHFFGDVDMEHQNVHFKALLTMLFGAPIDYEGRSLEEIHQKLNITASDFKIIGGMFRETLEELEVRNELADQVMNILGSMRSVIVFNDEL